MRTITVVGRVVRDPELREVQENLQVADVIVGANEPVRQGDGWESDTWWVRASFWNERAASIVDRLQRGDLVALTGTPFLHTYTRQDGTPGFEVRLRRPRLTTLHRQQGSPAEPQGDPGGEAPDEAEEDTESDVQRYLQSLAQQRNGQAAKPASQPAPAPRPAPRPAPQPVRPVRSGAVIKNTKN